MILRMTRERLDLLRTSAREHGDISQLQLGKQRVVLLTHPDDIRDVLVTRQKHFRKGQALERAKVLVGEGLLTAEGEHHLRQRRLVQPAFHRTRIAAYAEAMSGAAIARQAVWRDGRLLDAHRAMMDITLDIVAATLFGADVGNETSEIGKAMDSGPLAAESSVRLRRRSFRLHTFIARHSSSNGMRPKPRRMCESTACTSKKRRPRSAIRSRSLYWIPRTRLAKLAIF